MNDEEFKKKFPGLIKNQCTFHKAPMCRNLFFIDVDIDNNCLDKQRVKEAIKKLIQDHFSTESEQDFPTLTAEYIDTVFKKNMGLGE